MKLIQNNPFRIVGLLVGATAREQNRQVNRLKQFLEAGQAPDDDFSFPALGKISRTVDSVTDAASKLNLDSDKINAALFWFWNGNPITDEAAFDALKDGDTETAIEVWKKLTYGSDDEYNEVTKRNASAFHNLSTLYLSEYGIDEDTLQLKLLFLESDFVNEFKAKATDETFKTTKKELQLFFLNNLSQQGDFDTSEFLEAVSDIEFIAKADFIKSFVQKPIEQIEQKIETTKNKRKASKANAAKAGQELYDTTANDLTQLKGIVGTSDIKYSSIADKVANEMLQCSIDYFNDSQENELGSDYHETALILAKLAQIVAVGSVVKGRVKENLEAIEEIKKRNLCWYCKNNVADNKCSHSVEIYKETYRSSWYETRKTVQFKQARFHIPRCKHCHGIHNLSTWYSGCLFHSGLWLIWYIIAILVFDFEGKLFWSIPISGIPTVIVFLIISDSVSSNNAKKNNILTESNINGFPPFSQLLKEGWTTSKPEA